MRGRRHAFLTLALLYDAVAVAAAWILAFWIRLRSGWIPLGDYPRAPWSECFELLPALLPISLALLGVSGLYRPGRTRALPRELGHLAKASFLAWACTLAFAYYYRRGPYSRVALGLFLVASPFALLASRRLLATTLGAFTSRDWFVQEAAVVGAGRLGQKLSLWLARNRWIGTRVRYFVDDDPRRVGATLRGLPVRGPLRSLESILLADPVPAVFVALSGSQSARLDEALETLSRLPVAVHVVPDLAPLEPSELQMSALDDLPILHVRESRIQGWNAVLKRAMDLVIGSIALLLAAVPMIGIAILVKLTSSGPVLYRQRRVGVGTAPFTMLKFRSMTEDAERETGHVWAKKDDPRTTPVGRFLRRTSLDELPQLFNVLRGEMSLVGPRPERPEFQGEFRHRYPSFLLRTQVKAGMTGWAQVSGLRGNTSLRKRLQYDLYYIQHWSPLFDLYILALTPFVGFLNPHAY